MTRPRTSDDTPDAAQHLLDFGQQIIAGMKRTTGVGEPDPGAQFDEGRREFSITGQTLLSAAADERWDGAGARAYADQNTRQQVRTESMADADHAVFSVLDREARQIKLRRETLDDQSEILARTNCATLPLQFIPRYGDAAKLAIESSALSGALLGSAQALHDLHDDVSANAAELSQVVGRYAQVADGADVSDGDVRPAEPEQVGRPTPLPDSVHPETSPGPTAGQATNVGEGVHVGG
ncbi:EspA/EspE family type VII secretion system effector [Mycobacterium sp. NPDC051804]|uniref:EspA/EspE family type VII secretion system effector n=1 Tax=Mycobacterium sp. NPDC051804 TaxID=3364295 RepID=UPI0037A91E3F